MVVKTKILIPYLEEIILEIRDKKETIDFYSERFKQSKLNDFDEFKRTYENLRDYEYFIKNKEIYKLDKFTNNLENKILREFLDKKPRIYNKTAITGLVDQIKKDKKYINYLLIRSGF